MVHVQQNLGNCGDINHRFEKAEGSREHSPTLDDGSGAECVQRHVGDPRQNDEREGDGDGSIHGWPTVAVARLGSVANCFSGFASFGNAWWFTIRREPRWPVRNVHIHWTKTVMRRLVVARNWIWIAAQASHATKPLM